VRNAPEGAATLGGQSDGEHQQRDDCKRMGLAEPAVLKDAVASETGEHGAADEHLPCKGPRGNLLAAQERDNPGKKRDQADPGVGDS